MIIAVKNPHISISFYVLLPSNYQSILIKVLFSYKSDLMYTWVGFLDSENLS